MILNEPGALYEHTPGPAGRIKDEPVVRFDNFDYEPDQACRCEELSTLLPFLHREFADEIFVDFSEYVTFDIIRNRGEDAEELEEGRVVDLLVILRQDIFEVLILRFDGFHCFVDGLADIVALGKFLQVGEPRCIGNEESDPRLKIYFGRSPSV